ncbi:MAG: DNA modification methylase [Candidatus Methanomethylophilaceae archaeon]
MDNNIVTMPIKDIHPYEGNPRINDDAVEAVAASIREFGFRNPIIVDKDMVIIAGHTRYKAAKSMKMKEVPVIVADDLSDEQVRAYRLADNKTGELAEWDFDMLDFELAEIADIDMPQFGFDPSEIEDALINSGEIVEDDFDAEPPEEPVTKRGDIYRLGDHILMCGDSTLEADMFKLMRGGEKADMVFTDPPWNVDYGQDHPSWKPRKIINDNMSSEEFRRFLTNIMARMKDSLKKGGMVYVVMSAQEWGSLMSVLEGSGFHWSPTIIWNKDRFVLSRKDYHTKYEPIWYGWEDSAPRVHPLDDRKQCDVWDVPRPMVSDEHPTMKPIELVAMAVRNSSDKGDIVLDQFGGSGSTLIACEQTGRRCRMMELDPHYCDVIVRRWEEFTGKKAELVEEGEHD